MEIIILIVLIAAIVLILLTRSKTNELGETLNELYGRTNVLDGEIIDIKTNLNKLQFSLLKFNKVGSVFNKNLTIHDALKLHPDAPSVFKTFHLGGCSSCSVGADETIEEGAAAHNVDLDKLLVELNKLE